MAYYYTEQDPPYFLSLGAGVQSSTLALMAAYGEVKPAPVAAIFADTQAESQTVYDWLNYLEQEIQKAPFPFPIYRVSAGNLEQDSTKVYTIQKEGGKYPVGTTYLRKLIPLAVKRKDGKIGFAMQRMCTRDYKINPILKEIRRVVRTLNYRKTKGVFQYLGISFDEIQRMKENRQEWITNLFPLIERKMTRNDCHVWLRERGFPEPPRSACYFCPFYTNYEWQKMKDEDPEYFQKAVEFERRLKEAYKDNAMIQNEVFLHGSGKTLDKADFSWQNKREDGMLAECEGMCGV